MKYTTLMLAATGITTVVALPAYPANVHHSSISRRTPAGEDTPAEGPPPAAAEAPFADPEPPAVPEAPVVPETPAVNPPTPESDKLSLGLGSDGVYRHSTDTTADPKAANPVNPNAKDVKRLRIPDTEGFEKAYKEKHPTGLKKQASRVFGKVFGGNKDKDQGTQQPEASGSGSQPPPQEGESSLAPPPDKTVKKQPSLILKTALKGVKSMTNLLNPSDPKGKGKGPQNPEDDGYEKLPSDDEGGGATV